MQVAVGYFLTTVSIICSTCSACNSSTSCLEAKVAEAEVAAVHDL